MNEHKTAQKEFIIRGQARQFIAIAEFRENYQLEDNFALELFQPKDYQELGSIEGAGSDLAAFYETILAAIPSHTPGSGWMAFLMELQILFRHQLYAINAHIGLKASEVDYAALNFGVICQEFISSLINKRMRDQTDACFDEVYKTWLNRTIEMSLRYFYLYHDELWHIELVRHAYGRMGLIIKTHADTHYVYDASLACPAEKFMEQLSRAIAEKISAAFYQNLEKVYPNEQS
jgi:hypothetical protein